MHKGYDKGWCSHGDEYAKECARLDEACACVDDVCRLMLTQTWLCVVLVLV